MDFIKYVEVANFKICGKGITHKLSENQKEVSEIIYNELVAFPADYMEDENENIIRVTCPEMAPEPKTEIQLLMEENELLKTKIANTDSVVDFIMFNVLPTLFPVE